MRSVLLAGLLLTATAQAQATPASQPPAPPPSARSPDPTTPASPDTALLRGILWATEPAPEEVRVIAIEDLALLGDPRALDPLAALVWDPSPRVQAAAVRAVALFQHPRAEQILSDVVRHPSLPEPLKLQALDGLLFQRTPSAHAFVRDAARNPRYSLTVQSAALAVANKWNAPLPASESSK